MAGSGVVFGVVVVVEVVCCQSISRDVGLLAKQCTSKKRKKVIIAPYVGKYSKVLSSRCYLLALWLVARLSDNLNGGLELAAQEGRTTVTSVLQQHLT